MAVPFYHRLIFFLHLLSLLFPHHSVNVVNCIFVDFLLLNQPYYISHYRLGCAALISITKISIETWLLRVQQVSTSALCLFYSYSKTWSGGQGILTHASVVIVAQHQKIFLSQFSALAQKRFGSLLHTALLPKLLLWMWGNEILLCTQKVGNWDWVTIRSLHYRAAPG